MTTEIRIDGTSVLELEKLRQLAAGYEQVGLLLGHLREMADFAEKVEAYFAAASRLEAEIDALRRSQLPKAMLGRPRNSRKWTAPITLDAIAGLYVRLNYEASDLEEQTRRLNAELESREEAKSA